MDYVELTNKTNIRGKIVPVDKVRMVSMKPRDEWYRSVYRYDKAILDHLQETGSMKGYNGTVYADLIPIDIDVEEDGSHLLKTIAVVNRLEDVGVDTKTEIQIYFSGRGFHVMLPQELFGLEPSTNLAIKVKSAIKELFKDDSIMIDYSIYDKTRIFRVPNTLNQKSSLFKIPLSQNELYNLSLDEIKEIAKSPRNTEEIETDTIQPILKKFCKIVIANNSIKKNSTSNVTNVTPTEVRKYNCINTLLNEKPVKGSIHSISMRLISHFKRENYPKNITYSIMKGWMNGEHLDDTMERVNSVYDGEYKYSCQDSILASRCDPNCLFFKNPSLLGGDVVIANSQEMAKKTNTFLTSEFDVISLKFWGIDTDLYPGTLTTIIGRTGSGKTALVQNILSQITYPTLVFSMEMDYAKMYRRQCQIHFKMPKQKAEAKIKADPRFGVKELSHIYTTTQSPKPEEIERFVNLAPVKPHVIVIDHLLLLGGGGGEYEKVGAATRLLKQLSLKGYIVIAISQVSRMEHQAKHLGTTSGKGNGSIEADSDSVFLLDGNIGDGQVRFYSSKEREGQHFDIVLDTEPSKLLFK